ncbi:hypothetical protein [Metabacillus litoralis]|uniref:hypothetical protein n=1 Tax=Metabacillus litoralis TaxID=152268 RepID=UPI001CFD3D21|nr:hypothetical protein [Metabacillus litoralis]
MVQGTVERKKQNNSKLLKGVIVGGAIGGCISLLDKNTRKNVSENATNMKETSKNVITHVKENPGEVKEHLLDQSKQITDTLKNTIQEAKDLVNKINSDIVEDAKEVTDEAASFAQETKEDLKGIKSDLKTTGSHLTESNDLKPKTQAELNANLNHY